MKNITEIALDGQIWVCNKCGKTNKDRYAFRDVSCALNAVLCHEDKRPDNNGDMVYWPVEN